MIDDILQIDAISNTFVTPPPPPSLAEIAKFLVAGFFLAGGILGMAANVLTEINVGLEAALGAARALGDEKTIEELESTLAAAIPPGASRALGALGGGTVCHQNSIIHVCSNG